MTNHSNSPAPGQRFDKDYAYDTYDEAYYQSVLRNVKFRSHAWRLRWVDECLKPGPGDNIVDLGCGPGVLASHLAGRGATVHGVDLSEVAVRFAREFNRQYPSASFAVADASNCTHLQDASFDKALSADVTEHCGYDVMCDIFREAYRLLKPGGLYLVYTPNPKHWIELCRRHHIILKPFPGHTGLREAPVIIDALGKAGFELARHLRPPSMIPVFQWLEKAWSLQPLWRDLAIYRIVLLARKPAAPTA
jgi:cyclopropane fatty-acyl-phospholipid synthase-like methyltransferase